MIYTMTKEDARPTFGGGRILFDAESSGARVLVATPIMADPREVRARELNLPTRTTPLGYVSSVGVKRDPGTIPAETPVTPRDSARARVQGIKTFLLVGAIIVLAGALAVKA